MFVHLSARARLRSDGACARQSDGQRDYCLGSWKSFTMVLNPPFAL